MKTQWLTIFFISMFASSTLQASHSELFTEKTDSIVLQKNSSGREVVIRTDSMIKVWLDNSRPIKGKFMARNENIIHIKRFNKVFEVPIQSIKKLRRYQTARSIAGGTVQILGTTIVLFGGILHFSFDQSFTEKELGEKGPNFITDFAAPVTGLVIVVIYLGSLIKGKMNLQKKWKVLPLEE